MSKLKECPSCGKEVAKSAKLCPHCGKKLKMGMFLKLIIGIVVIIVAIVALQPSSEDTQKALNNKLDEITNATPANLDSAELAEIFAVMSDSTKIQKENKEKEIKGEIVEWDLKIFNVTKRDDYYRVQTLPSKNMPPTFVSLYPRNEGHKTIIEGVKGGDFLKIKGIISGTSVTGSIEISPAVLMQ